LPPFTIYQPASYHAKSFASSEIDGLGVLSGLLQKLELVSVALVLVVPLPTLWCEKLHR
jgi:hypothetical protein